MNWAKEFLFSLIELIEEVKFENPISEKYNINQMDFSPKYQSLENFDLLDKSLGNLLLNLSIQRNKINELKNQFQHLIKKETYWRQKEITLNKIR